MHVLFYPEPEKNPVDGDYNLEVKVDEGRRTEMVVGVITFNGVKHNIPFVIGNTHMGSGTVSTNTTGTLTATPKFFKAFEGFCKEHDSLYNHIGLCLFLEEHKNEHSNLFVRITILLTLICAVSYEKAIDVLKLVIEGNVWIWELYFLMGTAYLGLGNPDIAERYLDRGIAVNDKQIQLWIQRAVVEQQKGKP
ncbi:MAG: tetratricopeptide repeat protein [Candidatus Anammoxibacter sp.]